MRKEDAIAKILEKAEKEGMTGEQVYFYFLTGCHEVAVTAAREIAEAGPPRH